MALYLPLTSAEDTSVLPIMPNQTIELSEGMFINKATDLTDGKTKLVVPLGESDSELSCGIIIGYRETDADIPVVEELTFGSSGALVTVTPQFTPLNPTTDVLVINQDRTLAFNLSAVSGAAVTSFAASGDTLLGLASANTEGYYNPATNQIVAYGPVWAGQTITVVYRRALNKIWDKQFGNPYQGLMAQDVVGSAGFSILGVFYTTYFKTGDNWFNFSAGATLSGDGNPMVVAPGGYLTNANGAVGSTLLPDVLTGVVSIIDTPSCDMPYLGVRYTAN
jgi:hypothetical protein